MAQGLVTVSNVWWKETETFDLTSMPESLMSLIRRCLEYWSVIWTIWDNAITAGGGQAQTDPEIQNKGGGQTKNVGERAGKRSRSLDGYDSVSVKVSLPRDAKVTCPYDVC